MSHLVQKLKKRIKGSQDEVVRLPVENGNMSDNESDFCPLDISGDEGGETPGGDYVGAEGDGKDQSVPHTVKGTKKKSVLASGGGYSTLYKQ